MQIELTQVDMKEREVADSGLECTLHTTCFLLVKSWNSQKNVLKKKDAFALTYSLVMSQRNKMH